MAGAGISGLAVFYATAGGVLLWSGFKGQTVAQTVHAIVSGNSAALAQQGSQSVAGITVAAGPPTGSGSTSPGAATQGLLSTGTSIPGLTTGIPAGVAAGGTPTANKALGALMATAYGWGPGSKDWAYLESGWQEESGWNQHAANVPSDPFNHAYGIPQANPGTKMASAGSDWTTNPATQIKWGLGYIKATYGRPSQVPGWTPNGPAAGYAGY